MKKRKPRLRAVIRRLTEEYSTRRVIEETAAFMNAIGLGAWAREFDARAQIVRLEGEVHALERQRNAMKKKLKRAEKAASRAVSRGRP